MKETLEKIEKLFERFNVWELLGGNYWAMFLADLPEYAKQKHLKIKSVAYDPLIVMSQINIFIQKNSKTRKRWAILRSPTSIRGDSKRAIIRKPFIYKYVDEILLFTSREWMIILSRAPKLFEFAVSRGALNALDEYSRSFILHKQSSLGDRLCDKNKFEFSTSQAKEKSSLEIEFDKKLTDERQKAIEDINTQILNNEKSLIQITPRMWTLAIENNPAISDFVKSIRPQMGIKNRIFDL